MPIRTDASHRQPKRVVTENPRRPPSIEVVTASNEAAATVDPLFREYGEWVASQLERHVGVRLSDADLSRHHEAFRGELPQLLGPRGRLIVARVDGKPVGVGALRPVAAATGEIKRMYVQPAAQGRGVGRAILRHLIQDARDLRYATVRLETLQFMITAQSMYRSLGFAEIPGFDHSEASSNRLLDPITIFMELNLDVAATITIVDASAASSS